MEPNRTRPRAPPLRVHDLTTRDLSSRVLDGCCFEAERADRVNCCLQGLRNALPDHLHPHLTAIIDQLQSTSHLLRDLADKSQVHLSQVPVVIDYLNVILPCLCRTLRDIMTYYDDKYRSRESRWKIMYHNMSNELPGTTLPARFVMYNQFLGLLNFMLTRDPNFDVNAMEALRIRILQLREARKIDPPSPIRTDVARRDTALDFWQQETHSHWAEAIFTQPLPSRREFKKRGNSEAFGPLKRVGYLNPFPDEVKVLVKRTFENDHVSIMIFLRQADQAPFILARTRTGSGESWVCIRPLQKLGIVRESSSALLLSNWNSIEMTRKAWASLSFLTWEELVLFHCTFISIKARNKKDPVFDRHEAIGMREARLFQALIVEEASNHCLVILEDRKTKGRRLHAMVCDGPFKNCPVWTAFVPPDPPEDWLSHKSANRIWLRDLQVYSFCDHYHPHRQRRGRYGAFQIKFANAQAATRFKQLFDPIPAPSIEDPSDTHDVPEFSPSED